MDHPTSTSPNNNNFASFLHTFQTISDLKTEAIRLEAERRFRGAGAVFQNSKGKAVRFDDLDFDRLVALMNYYTSPMQPELVEKDLDVEKVLDQLRTDKGHSLGEGVEKNDELRLTEKGDDGRTTFVDLEQRFSITPTSHITITTANSVLHARRSRPEAPHTLRTPHQGEDDGSSQNAMHRKSLASVKVQASFV